MEIARYWVGVRMVSFGPAAILVWFSVHPFIAFWRNVGAKITIAGHFAGIQGDLMTDRYMKVVFTIIALALIWLGVKDTRLEPVVSAQLQGWDDVQLEQGLPNQNSVLGVLDDDQGWAFVCSSRLYPWSGFSQYGDAGLLRLSFYSEPACEGSSVGVGYMFSEGATHSWAHSSYLISEAGLMAYAEMTQRAAAYEQQVYYFRCSDTKTNCLKFLSFAGLDY